MTERLYAIQKGAKRNCKKKRVGRGSYNRTTKTVKCRDCRLLAKTCDGYLCGWNGAEITKELIRQEWVCKGFKKK